MKHFILFISLSIGILSCQPDPATTHDKAEYIPPGITRNMLLDNGQLRCPKPGHNCFLYLQEGDPPPIYNRMLLDSFYSDYAADSLERFFRTRDWPSLFPTESGIDTAIIRLILNKTYDIRVLSDSSIIVSSSPSTGIADSTILYALYRNDRHM